MGSDHSNGFPPLVCSLSPLRSAGRISALMYSISVTAVFFRRMGRYHFTISPGLGRFSLRLSGWSGNNSAWFGHIQATGAQVRGGDINELNGFALSNLNSEKMNSSAAVVKNLSKRFWIPHERRLTVYENIIGLIRGGSYTCEEFQVFSRHQLRCQAGRDFRDYAVSPFEGKC
jgi:hypothetical protein